jgi:hypothetical protein
MELANDALSPVWRSFDLYAPGYGGAYQGLTIEVTPPSLEPLSVPAGESIGALTHGVPQVVIPQGADNFVNGEHVERCGVGLSILPADLNRAEVRRCVRAVLGDAAFTVKAGELEREVAAMPGAKEVARELADRFGRHR